MSSSVIILQWQWLSNPNLPISISLAKGTSASHIVFPSLTRASRNFSVIKAPSSFQLQKLKTLLKVFFITLCLSLLTSTRCKVLLISPSQCYSWAPHPVLCFSREDLGHSLVLIMPPFLSPHSCHIKVGLLHLAFKTVPSLGSLYYPQHESSGFCTEFCPGYRLLSLRHS